MHIYPYKTITRAGFTLIELVVAITILSIIMVSVFEAYSNIIGINKRLETLRTLQENARNITETIASDVREKGIDFAYYDGSDATKKTSYTSNGTSVLAIRGGTKYYPMYQDSVGNNVLCNETSLRDVNAHCFLGVETPAGKRLPITGASVKIDQIRFFLSGDEKNTATNRSGEGKTQLVFSLESTKIGGAIAPVSLQVQTTISEKTYKQE